MRAATAVVVLAVAMVSPPGASAQTFRWWNDAAAKRFLELTDAQSARIDRIFRTALPQLRANRRALDREQATFDRLLAEGREAEALAQIDVLGEAQVRRNTDRARMLLEIAQVLSAQQRQRLDEWNALRDRRGR